MCTYFICLNAFPSRCRELFSPSQKYQLLVYHADAIFHDKEYRNAACKYSMALQQKKVISKTSKVRTSTGGASNVQAQVAHHNSQNICRLNVLLRLRYKVSY